MCLITNSRLVLKLYPVLVSAAMLCAFGATLFSPPVMVFRFALLQDKSIRGSLAEKRVEKYCRKVTLVWCAFFILNGGTALFTVFFASERLWSVYNAGLSYILMGTLFAGEFIVRKMIDKKMPKAVPLSRFTEGSRPADTVLCYEQTWSEGPRKTWRDFLDDTARLRRLIRTEASLKWILRTEDYWYFLAAFTALLQCGKQVLLAAGASPACIAEIRDNETAFLTDMEFSPEETGDALFIPALLEGDSPVTSTAPAEDLPRINAEEAVIVTYTCGPAGKGEAAGRRLSEFERDSRFVLAKWGEEWLARKVCSTVDPHHIYGLLFSVLIPFTAGVPFRRKRIERLEEWEQCAGASGEDSRMLITSPAFLQEAAEAQSPEKGVFRNPPRSPWIFSSEGASAETAEKAGGLFGFRPVEIRAGTGGIAWRRSGERSEWIPLDPPDNGETGKNDRNGDILRGHGIPAEKILEKNGDTLLLEIAVPPDCDYFDGHFPVIKVLPAVAQLELVIRLAARYFGTGVHVSKVKRIKFSKLLRPGAVLRIKLELQPRSGLIAFTISTPDEKQVYSSGTFMPDRIIKQGFVIPVYNHGRTAGPLVEKLSRCGLPIIMVDDGSDAETRSLLAAAAAGCPLTVLLTLEKNRGKGAAVIAGIEKAGAMGLTHVLQIDADGQHAPDRSGFFLEESAAHPEAAICAWPEYDDSVPLSRKYGRKIANAWANIVTLSGGVADAMMGFRVYPVEPFLRVCRGQHVDRRMGFDIEMLVRLYWLGIPLVFHPVKVSYPKDGISHFRAGLDNIRISGVFTRLFFGMLIRLPRLVRRRAV
ncbi:MAG: glycosyltransferase [Treponema sp.]|nr:glycosyltransferase [Treponema sp.]